MELVNTCCDKCGVVSVNENMDEDIISFSASFGYPSERDQERVDFDLCDKCLMDILDSNGVKYKYSKYDENERKNNVL